MRKAGLAAALLLLLLPARGGPRQDPFFRITVVDDRTGRGVPLVELETVHHLCYVTDSQGVIAFREEGLMGRKVFFLVRSHGYEFRKDSLGNRGVALTVEEGGEAVLKVHRLQIAERLYRITGAGIYRDSLLTGSAVPLREPLLNGQVLGQDSVVAAVFKGKLSWFWGDTHRPSYALGNFHVPGAVSRLPADGGLDPEVGVDLEYFLDRNGFAKETCCMPGEGPTWIGGLVVLKDAGGRERMFAGYVKIKLPLTAYERGIVEFDDEKKVFRKVAEYDLKAPAFLWMRTFLRKEGGVEYVVSGDPFPIFRVRADPDALKDPAAYECFTCLKEDGQPDRGPDGKIRYAWRRGVPCLNAQQEPGFVGRGLLKPEEALFQLKDVESGKGVVVQGGSVCWNPWRRRWVMIAVELFGTSPLGEVWFAEADPPLGPWVFARKIVTHEAYTFYNPTQHPEFDKEGGRVIFLEGTYTTFMCPDSTKPTPRYDYNQVMYKLDLADPRLALPVPVYRLLDGSLRPGLPEGVPELPPIAFFALDREVPGALKVTGAEPPCWGLPSDLKDPPPGTELFAGCRVWKSPFGIRLPAP